MRPVVLAVGEIRSNPANIRGDLGDVAELARSIAAHGLLQPVVVQETPRGWELVDGHRRLVAARRAGLARVPALAVPPGDGETTLTRMLAAAMHEQLSPIDQAHAFTALRNRGIAISEIARRTGYSPATVSARLLLVDLPAEAQDMVRDGALPITEAVELARQTRARRSGSAVPRQPKARWLSAAHRLARAAAQSCNHQGTRVLVGPACGQFWETAIRADERRHTEQEAAG